MFESVFRVCKKYFVEFENFFVLADAKSVQQKWNQPIKLNNAFKTRR